MTPKTDYRIGKDLGMVIKTITMSIGPERTADVLRNLARQLDEIAAKHSHGSRGWVQASTLRHVHGWLTIAWLVIIPLSIATGWLYSLAFISAISIYANVAGHFSAWQAARAEEQAQDEDPGG
jgi:hypothetical protein